ncbi:MAG: hypothetical protein US83_C0003G0009 [Candidatus Falkowbacteria bacterium GW2011_GWC2_38_22]|uniref:HNH nuclease domain-containing protein n=1 Tax=Candidatus Falkowbacteria bacterium GW2011_GWE1_38_31 TaxID=1618638 RepID=A0A0G0MBR0_9BACT|nr:MAG: hypothetical protein US73_C0001G0101 [Candidatus Falkowbacteria bacterium GW2011_GWF2_38_1205]KKQ61760.1 MAG: hypothetical protein US83_C0003G0009 [Candidatus Falkowbacteria bacterium GW2011_GWC2_38_22]KKQ64068.1 MAG: hypothetical protein US84_C0002G0100 [Candidatus Falkowbacteria bacterium GW2011_GWF1_38_22]KKQ66583.1 MAG: hypothetical protein US87_C0001G0104 [Candidatus Falkowbacteria bacterium GW2011_GWE2_38_254]KKQ71174.1 MAG: hypothetical protein US91_C0001G0101 [Candidatus Falkowb
MPIVICKNCKKEFYAKPSHLARGWSKCCSVECRTVIQKKGKFEHCEVCGKEIWKMPKELKNSKSGKFFCNKSCQSKWRNTIYSGPKHKLWKGGLNVYRDILKKSGQKQICAKCGIQDKRILLVHHKDVNRKNNDIENLVWLCWNCHHLVHIHNIKI